MAEDTAGIVGKVIAELHDKDGNLISRCEVDNLVTAVGDQYYAGRAALATGLPVQVTGFRLGTGSTAPAKTGAGAAIVTYLLTSNQAPDATFPTVVAGVVTYKVTYAAGTANSVGVPITEVVLNNDTIANNNATTATAANTIARALLVGIGGKGVSDTLTITWTHTLLGA